MENVFKHKVRIIPRCQKKFIRRYYQSARDHNVGLKPANTKNVTKNDDRDYIDEHEK